MINVDRMGAQDDPLATTLHILRRIAYIISIILAVAALAVLSGGLTQDSIQAWNAGLATALASTVTGAVAACAYVAELVMRRLYSIEVGEQAIADTIGGLEDDGPDDLGRRRRGLG